MRVLLLAAAPPEPPRTGQRLRYRQHLLGLEAAGAEVGVVTFLRDRRDAEAFQRWSAGLPFAEGIAGGNRSAATTLRALLAGEPVHLAVYRDRRFDDALRRAIERFSPAVVVAGNGYLARCLDLVPAGTLRVVDEQNDEVEVWEIEARAHPSPLRRLFARVNGANLLRREPALLRSADLTLAVSEHDRRRFLDRGRPAVEVVPNGIDTGRFAGADAPLRDPTEVLFSGTDATRNLEALAWFLSEAWPKVLREEPSARLTVAGSFSPASQRRFAGAQRVSFTGTVPDVVPYYRRASVFVAPFRLGGGSRLKILEAGAAGLAVVSTPEGIRGLELEPGRDLLLARDAPSFAGEVVRLLRFPTHRATLGGAIRRTVENRHDVARLGERLLGILERAVAAKAAGAS